MKPGMIVKFIECLPGEDPETLYKIIENNGDRLLIQLVSSQFNLLPTFVVLTSDVKAVGK